MFWPWSKWIWTLCTYEVTDCATDWFIMVWRRGFSEQPVCVHMFLYIWSQSWDRYRTTLICILNKSVAMFGWTERCPKWPAPLISVSCWACSVAVLPGGCHPKKSYNGEMNEWCIYIYIYTHIYIYKIGMQIYMYMYMYILNICN
jgi:hypothetical protein